MFGETPNITRETRMLPKPFEQLELFGSAFDRSAVGVGLSHHDGYCLRQTPPEHAACSAMRLVHLTAGTGSFFCGMCLRDHALVKALRRLGHDALMVPMYLPLVLDDFGRSESTPLCAPSTSGPWACSASLFVLPASPNSKCIL
jgi:hypothetical protein